MDIILRAKFKKEKDLIFISHLDLVRSIIRTLRRGEFPVLYTEGFNKRVKLETSPPLPLGIESGSEFFDLHLEKEMSTEDFINTFNLNSPDGLEVIDAKYLTKDAPSLSSSINLFKYEIYFKSLVGEEELFLINKISKILNEDKIYVNRYIKNSVLKKEIRDFIKDIKYREQILYAFFYLAPSGSIRINEFNDLIFEDMQSIKEKVEKIKKSGSFIEKDGVVLDIFSAF